MAKCVRVVGQGVPVRMTDDEAFQIVMRDKDGEYCSKSFWRNWNGAKSTGEMSLTTTALQKLQEVTR